VEEATENDLYRAMDWLLERKERIEKKLAGRHLREGGLVLYDVTSSFYEGRTCPWAQYGYNRDGEKGLPSIVYGVMTDGGAADGGGGLCGPYGRVDDGSRLGEEAGGAVWAGASGKGGRPGHADSVAD